MGIPNMMLKGLLSTQSARLAICASTARADDAAYQEKAKAYPRQRRRAGHQMETGPLRGRRASARSWFAHRPHRTWAQRRRAGRGPTACHGSRFSRRSAGRFASLTARAWCLVAPRRFAAGDRHEAGRHSQRRHRQRASRRASLFEQAAAAGIKVVGCARWSPSRGQTAEIPSVPAPT